MEKKHRFPMTPRYAILSGKKVQRFELQTGNDGSIMVKTPLALVTITARVTNDEGNQGDSIVISHAPGADVDSFPFETPVGKEWSTNHIAVSIAPKKGA
ncbi:MAG: hypothetical protein ACYC9V_09695 [Desulfobacteria bacterium]